MKSKTKLKARPKKEKISIMGKQYKVDKSISDTLKALSEALHAHEVALLTWLHKEYTGEKLKKEDLEAFRSSLREYCMQIPEAENILKRMKEIDSQMTQEIKDKEDKNKNGKEQGVKE